VSDDELRRLLRERDLSPGDTGLARRVAALAARKGERDLAVPAWQEVLRRSPQDDEAGRRLLELGCELRYTGTDALGFEEYESAVDGSTLVRTPLLARCFVARQPVTYEQYHRFLSREGTGARSQKWITSHGPLRRILDVWTLRGEAASNYVQEVSWLGAQAYASWAGGRLLTVAEWEALADASAAFEGLDRTDGEWLDGLRGGQRPVMTMWDPKWPPARATHELWYAEEECPSVIFRYARNSWFRE
jgi:hypothetical protein